MSTFEPPKRFLMGPGSSNVKPRVLKEEEIGRASCRERV